MDRVLQEIAAHAAGAAPCPPSGRAAAALCLLDAMGCALRALDVPDCARRLPRASSGGPSRVPGTRLRLEPAEAAFATGCAVRWLDWNDTWLAAEWGHPSDTLGALLAVAEAAGREGAPLPMARVLDAAVRAYEIQGALALETALNRHGMDHVVFVRVACAAVCAALMGGGRDEAAAAASHAFADGGPLRVYRHAGATTARKSWAAGDAAARGVRLAAMAVAGEPAIGAVLTAPGWGFQDALLGGDPVRLARPLGSHVIENVLFKPFPAEFHAQTAVEAALALRPRLSGREEAVARIEIETHEAAVRIIARDGPLTGPADRDHCLQYMTVIALLHGEPAPEGYEDAFHAADPRIDRLRARTAVREEPAFTDAYRDPARRAVPNRVRVVLEGGEAHEATVEYPLGHPRRRAEALPALLAKFRANAAGRLPAERAERLAALALDPERLAALPVPAYIDLLLPG